MSSSPSLCRCADPDFQRVEGVLVCNECGEQVLSAIDRKMLDHLEHLSVRLARLETRLSEVQAIPLGSEGGLVSTSDLAKRLGVKPAWVRDHASELGALRLTDGDKPRLFFRWSEVEKRLDACSTGSRAEAAEPRSPKPKAPRKRRRSAGTDEALLPIKGSKAA